MRSPRRSPFTLGRVAYAAVMFALVYVCLCFPRGRLGSRRDRRFVGVLGAVLGRDLGCSCWLLAEELPPSGPFAACAAACPRERVAAVRRGAEAPGGVLGDVANAVTVASFVAVTGLLLAAHARVRSRGPPHAHAARSSRWPRSSCRWRPTRIAREVSDARPPVASAAVAVTVLLVPVAILAGQVRGRLFAARRLGSLVADVAGTPVTGEDVQHLVGDALGDPTLTLARWDGAGVSRPRSGGPAARTATARRLELTRDGRPVRAGAATTPRSTSRPTWCAASRRPD